MGHSTGGGDASTRAQALGLVEPLRSRPPVEGCVGGRNRGQGVRRRGGCVDFAAAVGSGDVRAAVGAAGVVAEAAGGQ